MSLVVKQDARSTTYRNLALIRKETGVNTFVVLLLREMESLMEDTTIISAMIDSLCSS